MTKEERRKIAVAHDGMINAKFASANKGCTEASVVLREVVFDKSKKAKISVIDSTTEECIDKSGIVNPCVLNFASFTRAGGGFINGAIAQEEALCHASNLYEVLKNFQNEYDENYKSHMNDGLYKNFAIYSPKIIFTFHMEEGDSKYMYTRMASVITCASPNFNAFKQKKSGMNDDDLERIIRSTLDSRIRYILDIAEHYHQKDLILGAFGCGVFGNSPYMVASIFKEALNDYHFQNVIFAIPNSDKNENYKAFKEIFS